MRQAVRLACGVLVFLGFSALGYVIMAGGFPGALWSDFTATIRSLSAPVVGLLGAGVTGGSIIVLGSVLAGYILFATSPVEDEHASG